jgi:Cu2+-exporting ATPase
VTTTTTAIAGTPAPAPKARKTPPPRTSPRDDVASPARCLHCGAERGAGSVGEFCCAGCRAVHDLLRSEHLERYYDLRGPLGNPVADTRPESRDRKWIEVIDAKRPAGGGLARVDLDVQGLHCAGCVFLFEELFARQPGGARILVNPSLGTVELTVEERFPLRAFVEQIERFGYVLGPASGDARKPASDLVLRMGVCIAIAMNSMIFAISIYAGLDDPALLRGATRSGMIARRRVGAHGSDNGGKAQ